jgi:hypothetical protein
MLRKIDFENHGEVFGDFETREIKNSNLPNRKGFTSLNESYGLVEKPA